MNTHAEKKIVPYTCQQMYDLVLDVEKYPLFLPWCLDTKIITEHEGEKIVDLSIGFKIFRETFTSRVAGAAPSQINVSYEKGPLKSLNNHWKFEPVGEHHCEIDFYVEFGFESSFFQSAMSFFFNEAVKIMISAFEKRAHDIYGSVAS